MEHSEERPKKQGNPSTIGNDECVVTHIDGNNHVSVEGCDDVLTLARHRAWAQRVRHWCACWCRAQRAAWAFRNAI